MPNFTKKAIKASFLKLLNKYPLDKITVKNIVDDCQINRNTFYYHYQDIYALIDEIFREDTQKVIADHFENHTIEQACIEAVEFIVNNRKAVNHIYNSISRDKLEDYLGNIFDPLAIKFTRESAEGLDVTEKDIQLIAYFYKYAIQGYVLNWIKSGIDTNIDFNQEIKQMTIMLDGSMEYFLHKAAGDK